VESPRSNVVPKSMQAAYDAVAGLTDAFCRDHLNDEYRELARAMTAALSRKRPSPLTSGQPRTGSAVSSTYWAGSTSCRTRRASPT
jgi:hypothetical protein